MELQPASPAKPRIPYACEACRVAKVKCQPSTTASICQRCAASRRECVFKTGPRTRRRRSKLHPAATRSTPPPSAPSKTFTIDVPMAADNSVEMDASEAFYILRDAHEGTLEKILPDQDVAPGGSSNTAFTHATPSMTSGRDTTTSSTPSTASQSTHGFSSIQPQFNLDSATSLLDSFREGMLPAYPALVLAPDASVPSLARERPFVLLAILAATSSSRSLHGHNLYDEEFRKVLGLKFVSGSERSLELLVGLLIYIAWYPFHLRPKSRQALQYHQMAVDIVHDLELDQAPDEIDVGNNNRLDDTRLAEIRAYLASYVLCSSVSATWRKPQKVTYQQWTARCCDMLVTGRDRGKKVFKQDETLIWLVRLGHVAEQTVKLNDPKNPARHDQQHSLLVVKGLEAQLQEWQGLVPAEISCQTAVHLTNLMAEIMLCGYPLLQFPYQRLRKQPSTIQTYTDSSRLVKCVGLLRGWYDYIGTLSAAEFNHFPGTIWTNFVMSIILGLRLSFPIPNTCPDWDHAAARQVLEFGAFLDEFVAIGVPEPSPSLAPSSSDKAGTMDIFSASKVVVGVVKRKYDGRLKVLQENTAAMLQSRGSSSIDMIGQLQPVPLDEAVDSNLMSCPMLDGSLDAYLPEWAEASLGSNSLQLNPQLGTYVAGLGISDPSDQAGAGQWAGTPAQVQPAIFHDLWATMTMSWSQDEVGGADYNGV